jgi:hypothetical protein
MLIVDALSRVARHVSLTAPSSWITATDDEYVEIRDDFLAECVDDILERFDLPSPIGKQTTITGTGVETYALPSDFKRLQRVPLSVYDVQLDQAAIPITSDGDWTYLSSNGIAGASRYYRLSGYDGNFSISFLSEPSTDITVSYVSTNWMATAGGTAGHEFTSATDVLLIPERVIVTGIVWRWRARRGLPFSDVYSEHEALLSRFSNDAKGLRTVNFGAQKLVRWQDQVPAFIPAS